MRSLAHLRALTLAVATLAVPAAQAQAAAPDPPSASPTPAALLQQGMAFYHSQRYAEALPPISQACERGLAAACGGLGVIYEDGKGVSRDYGKAITYYAKACDGGTLLGCGNLGEMYENAKSVPQDYAKAAVLYSRACDGGVAADPDLARQYLGKACTLGEPASCTSLKAMK